MYYDAILDLRKKMLLTRTEFARLLKVDVSAVWRWEKGSRKPTMESIRKILQLAEKRKISATADQFE